MRDIAASGDDDEAAGRRVYRALIPTEGPLLGWQTEDDFARKHPQFADDFFAAVGRLARDRRPAGAAIMAAADRFAELRQQGATALTLGAMTCIAITVAGVARPEDAAPFKITKGRELARLLTGDGLFSGSSLTREQLDTWLDLLRRIETVMRDDWGWAPRDLIDVQGFAWVALDNKWVEDDEMDDEALLARFAGNPLFRRVRDTWSDEQSAAFCAIARAVHDAGLDWYHTNHARTPVRFGRKPEGATTAYAVQGYVIAGGPPRITLNSKGLALGVEQVMLDPASASDFADTMAEHAEAIAGWFPPKSARPGRWPDEAGVETEADTPIWLVTARNGEDDGLPGFVERGEWHLLEDRGGRMNELVREMQAGDRIVLRDFFSQKHDLPFDARGSRVTGLRIRATGIVTEQRGDGISVGVDWTVLPEPRLWFFYTNNDAVWRLRTDNEMARALAAFLFDDEPQDLDWFVARWFGSETTDMAEHGLPDPSNLILYGPPGTGKTYATAAHAVRLCDGLDDDDPLLGEGQREALMARYRELAGDERIEFVTFHQSMAYEDFVEGLRPSSVDDEGEPLAAGFRLAPTPGIFRKIALRAQMSTGANGEMFALGDRQVFKMSIGDATKPEWAWLFDEAIGEGYTYLGFGDIDWSDARFADRAEILAAVKEHDGPRGAFADGTEPSLQAGPVKSPDLFRNELKIGDVIVVSKGLSLFRAIGIVEGPYEYAPRGDGRYSHRRKVRWLWYDEDGVPIAEINAKRLSIETIYRLNRENLNVAALERYANSQRDAGAGTPQPFVLIIDEINRANISKVFGELITLIEPDKRLGKRNALKVRLPYSGDSFGVPANLHIIGTMNTADRSIALIDKALRRRFTFAEMMPDYDVPGMEAEVGGVTLAAILRAINDRIEYLLDREHQIGHGWLLGCDSKAALDAAMREKVIPLIAEYFFEDWGRTADVLGGRDDNPFLEAETLSPPPGLGEAEPRTRWSVRDSFAADAYARLIG